MKPDNEIETIDQVIRKRRTTKALSEQPLPISAGSKHVAEILAAAGWAPFHKPADRCHRQGELNGIEPWRCYWLDAQQCRDLRSRLLANGDATKIPKLLAASNALIQVTWLPKPSADPASSQLFEPSVENIEIIAAASAAIQNMLLAATARDIPNYWSSGGALRSLEVFELIGIPRGEILLGSVFLFPQALSDVETTSGSLRSQRSNPSQWCRQGNASP